MGKFGYSVYTMMWNIPNLLTLMRLPLALLFIPESTPLRTLVLIIAMVTDGLDGFLARRYRQISPLGTLLDPLMDKFFVMVVLTVLVSEESIGLGSGLLLLSRDVAVLLYGLFLLATARLHSYELKAIWCGKITTCLQFFLFLALLYQVRVPSGAYLIFVLLGLLALLELYFFDRKRLAT